tara:strand:- start:1326 stop:2084 length:759 start_codon:yes stop_codon:yes gene_type:complete
MVSFDSLLLILLALWLVVISYNIIFFLNEPSSIFDTFFIPKKTFNQAIEDLKLLRKFKGKEYLSAERKILFYQNNSQLTRRKYSYYRDRIEKGLVKLYFDNKKGFKDSFNQLDTPVKAFFILILGCFILGLVLLIALSFLLLLNGESLYFILIIIAGFGFLLRFYNVIFRINYLLLFFIVEIALYFNKSERGRLHRNFAVLDVLTKSWWGQGSYGGTVIAAGGVSSFSGSSGGGFGGFGGGSFGGGGAGGSW